MGATDVQPAALSSRMPVVAHDFGGVRGARLAANEARWLLTAPGANPSMLQVFRDRDRQPARDAYDRFVREASVLLA